jgi:seryl-tRNA synthetase
MSFDLSVFAQEFGIDPATLQAKPEVFKKWNGYLTEADGKYQSATQAQQQAQAALEQVKAEQAAIDQKIQSFGVSEAEIDALKANYAALEAQAKTLKAQGYNLTIPEMPVKPVEEAYDPKRLRDEVDRTIVVGFNLNNRYQRITGQPLPDDIEVLAREAKAHHLNIMDWADKKYGLTAKEQEKVTAARKAELDAAGAAAVAKYKEDHPVTAGNHELARPGESRFPEVARRPAPKAHENFGGTPAQRIARSVKRSMDFLQTQAS